MRGINKSILVGTLGGDPELRFTAAGLAIATFSIATNESWKDKETGEKRERVEWHRIKIFGRLGEIAGEYLKKGSRVYVEGKHRTEKYTDKEGIERFSAEIHAYDLQLLDRVERQEGQSQRPPQQQAQRRQQGGTPAPAPSNLPPPAASQFDDDDIPF